MRLVTYTVNGGDTARVGKILDDSVRELAAPSMIAWLNGEGRAGTGTEHSVDEVTLLAPVPEPPAYRDFFSYKGHVERATRNLAGMPGFEVPEYWYAGPGFYFGNAAAIVGTGQAVRRPKSVEWLDFELELAAIMGADQQLAGFTILNDWSGRDMQMRERDARSGCAQVKGFRDEPGTLAGHPDELPYEDDRLHVSGAR